MIREDVALVLSKPWLQRTEEILMVQTCIMEAGPGPYLEIGLRKGGSLAFAGLCQRKMGFPIDLYGIEREKEWEKSIGVVLGAFGLAAKLYYQPSHPWPAENVSPVVTLIDGGHDYETCSRDWFNVRERTRKYVLFHDVDLDGVKQTLDFLVKKDPLWHFVDEIGRMAVFERPQ